LAVEKCEGDLENLVKLMRLPQDSWVDQQTLNLSLLLKDKMDLLRSPKFMRSIIH
jgi:serine/threonine protein kinase